MTPKEFVECGGKILVLWDKRGYEVVASYDNEVLSRRYQGIHRDATSQIVATKQAVNECLFHRASHLRYQQTWNIQNGLGNDLPVDVFTGHPGLNNIG